MPSLVYDYPDIASRMKGELKQEPKVELLPPSSNSWWQARRFCAPCNGSGANPINGSSCRYCKGSGVSP